jgi:hypothetical protein
MARLEIGDRIRAAALDAGILPNDPLGPMYEALADLPYEIERITTETRADLQAVLEQAKAQAGGELARNAARELPMAIERAVLERFRWWAVLGGAALVLVAAVGFGAGWWYRGPSPIVAGLTGGTPRCDDQPDGSRLCWIPVWERPPPR